MIRYLKHIDIDKQKWDQCVNSASNGLVYGLSWYLDIVSPGWEALVDEDYQSVMPLPVKSKFGVRYLAQPIFTQQLGWFGSLPENAGMELNKLKRRFLFGFMNFNAAHTELIKKTTRHLNLVLGLDKAYSELQKRYSSNHKRNIQKVVKAKLHLNDLSVAEFQEMYQSTGWDKKYGLKDEHFIRLVDLLKTAVSDSCARLISIEDKHQNKLAACALFEYKNRITYLFPITSEQGYQQNAQFFLIDTIIRENEESEKVIDFEGSAIEGIKRFYKGFGAMDEFYYSYGFAKFKFLKPILRKLFGI